MNLQGLTPLVESAVGQSGLGNMDMDELEAALAGKEVRLGFQIDQTYCALGGSAPPKEATLFFQLLYAYLKDPGFREKSLDLAKTRYRQNYNALKRPPDGVMKILGNRFLAGGDLRFGLEDPDRIQKMTMDDIESWLRPAFESSPLEVFIVGDFDVSAFEVLAKTYLGALEDRKPVSETLPKESLPFPKGDTRTFNLDSKIDKGMVRVGFLTDDFWNIKQTRTLSVLSRVFSERLRKTVRETLGASYSPYVYNHPSLAFKGYGVMNFVVNVSPKSVQAVKEQIDLMIKDLVENGVTPEELSLVKAPLINHLAVLRQSNNYWLNSVMADSFRHPERLDWALDLVKGYSNITLGDVTRVAGQFIQAQDRALIVILPKTGE